MRAPENFRIFFSEMHVFLFIVCTFCSSKFRMTVMAASNSCFFLNQSRNRCEFNVLKFPSFNGRFQNFQAFAYSCVTGLVKINKSLTPTTTSFKYIET